MTIQGIHAHHHHRARQQIDILDTLKKRALVGVGPPVRGDDNGNDDSDNGSDNGGNDKSSLPEHTEKPQTSKPEQTSKPRVKTIEATKPKPTTQAPSTVPKAKSQTAHPTTEIETHSKGLPKTQATSSAQPLITTINSNDLSFDIKSTPTFDLTSSSGAFSTPKNADATTELVSATSAALSEDTNGLSGGAKAGVAIGVIAGVGVVAALVVFFIMRRRRQPRGTEELVDNEKSLPPPPPQNMTGRIKQSLGISNPPTHHQDLPTEPPRLAEVRPGSQFSPFRGRASMAPFAEGTVAEETPAAMAAANAAALFVPKSTTPEPLSRNLTNSPTSPPQSSGHNHQDPFGDPENIIVSSPEEETKPPPRPISKDSRFNNVGPKQESKDAQEPQKEQESEAGAHDVNPEQEHKDENAENDGDRTTEGNNSQILSNEANSEPSTVQSPPAAPPAVAANPVFTTFSPAVSQTASASSEALPRGPPYHPPSRPNVHRVLLDFDPQLDDELPLRRGRLVRLLHAYDDGWALCSLMDNSAQGVAPRTCLSPSPVKPRFHPGNSSPTPRPHPGAPGSASSGRNSPHPSGPAQQQDPLKPLPLNTAVSPTGHSPVSPVSSESSETARASKPAHASPRPSSEAAPAPLASPHAESPTSVNSGPAYSTVPKPLTPVHHLHVFPPVTKATPHEGKPPVAPYRPHSAANPFLKSTDLDPATKLSSQSDSAVNKAGLARGGKEEGKRIETPDGGHQAGGVSTPSPEQLDE